MVFVLPVTRFMRFQVRHRQLFFLLPGAVVDDSVDHVVIVLQSNLRTVEQVVREKSFDITESEGIHIVKGYVAGLPQGIRLCSGTAYGKTGIDSHTV